MAYASSTDLTTFGLPLTALGQLTAAQIAGALDVASQKVDSYLRGRYALPLLAWGSEITEATAKIAAYNLLTIRGYNPAAGADINIKLRFDDAITWLNKVQRQAAHPNVTPQNTQATYYGQPKVTSQSVTQVFTGATAANRGW